MGDEEITEADLPELLKQLTSEDLILALQLLRVIKEYDCNLHGVISALKLRKKTNERCSAYYQHHKAERNAYYASYMRKYRSKKAGRSEEPAQQSAEVTSQ